MIDFIDKTGEQDGTPINRENLMAMQGFLERVVIQKADGSIEETNTSNGHKLITKKNDDGSITETFIGDRTITKTIKVENGIITEELINGLW